MKRLYCYNFLSEIWLLTFFFVLQGQQFTSGCSSSDFTVVIKGSSANFSCTIKSLEKEMIKCEPDIDFPGVNDEDAMIMVRTTKKLRLF